MKKYEENNTASRILQPNRSMEDIGIYKNSKIKVDNGNKNLERCGSITSLFEKTPNLESKYKLHSEKMNKDSQIFLPDTKAKKRLRATYNHNLDSKDPLNVYVPESKDFHFSCIKMYLLFFIL